MRIEINDDAMTDYVFLKLLEKGIILSKSDISLIFKLEMEYILKYGLIEGE